MDEPYLTGRVVDDAGTPLAGIEVSLDDSEIILELDVAGAVDVLRPERRAVTGRDGRFAFSERSLRDPADDDWEEWQEVDSDGNPVDDDDRDWLEVPWRVILRRGREYDVRAAIDVSGGPVDVGDVIFRPVPVRRVRVVMSDGAPPVRGTLTANLFSRATREASIFEIELDEDGAATVPLLGVGGDSILIWSARGPGLVAKGTRYDGDWRLPRDAPLVLVAPCAYRVRGRALDGAGAPVPGLIVDVHGTEPRTVAEIRAAEYHTATAGDGTFDVEAVRRGDVAVHLHTGWRLRDGPDGEEVTLGRPVGTVRASIPIAPGDGSDSIEVGDVIVRDAPGARRRRRQARGLRVRVIDGRGRPIAGARVSVGLDPYDGDDEAPPVPTGGDGRAVFPDILRQEEPAGAPALTYGAMVDALIDDVECWGQATGLLPGPDDIPIVVSGAGRVRIDLVAAEDPDADTEFRFVRVDVDGERDCGIEDRARSVTVSARRERVALVIRASGRAAVTLPDVEVLRDRPTRLRVVLAPSPPE